MTGKKQRFIMRQQSNAVTEEYLSTFTEIENVYDYLVTMGADYSKNKTPTNYNSIGWSFKYYTINKLPYCNSKTFLSKF